MRLYLESLIDAADRRTPDRLPRLRLVFRIKDRETVTDALHHFVSPAEMLGDSPHTGLLHRREVTEGQSLRVVEYQFDEHGLRTRPFRVPHR